MSATPSTFQLMPEFTKGLGFFFLSLRCFLIMIVFYCWFWSEPAQVLSVLQVPTFSICTCSTWGGLPPAADGMSWWDEPPAVHRLCQQSRSSDNLCVLNRAEDFFPHASFACVGCHKPMQKAAFTNKTACPPSQTGMPDGRDGGSRIQALLSNHVDLDLVLPALTTETHSRIFKIGTVGAARHNIYK